MKIFYRPEQSFQQASAASFSPSAGKPERVIADWHNHGLIANHPVVSFEPVTPQDLMLAHSPDYVCGVLDGTLANGFGNTNPSVAATLPYTVGSMVAAATDALATRSHNCSPTSGFHHAHYRRAEGFCTFNGLIVTAMSMTVRKLAKRIGILDCDQHYGNGTANLIQRQSMFNVVHRTAGQFFSNADDAGHRGQGYFDWLDRSMDDMDDCDLILYQAGADCHINDPLGGYLTTKQMALRDSRVFEHFRSRPLVWNLAGGYQTDAKGSIAPVLTLHRHTLIQCIYGEQPANIK